MLKTIITQNFSLGEMLMHKHVWKYEKKDIILKVKTRSQNLDYVV